MSDIDDRPRDLVITTSLDEGDRVRLTVRDAGVGLNPENTDQLFEPFYTTKSGGMGIGLNVSQEIVKAHRGVVTVNNAPTGGAVVTFLIPALP